MNIYALTSVKITNKEVLSQFIREREVLQRRMAKKVLQIFSERLRKTIESYVGYIDDEWSKHKILDGIVVEKIHDYRYRITNTSQEATYAEFGTGIIGELLPHEIPDIHWRYDVNEHGIGGWWYWNDFEGDYVHTRGLPAYQSYYKAFNEVLKQLDNIVEEAREEVLKQEYFSRENMNKRRGIK